MSGLALLAARTPGRRSAADCCLAQWQSMLRAHPVALPLLMDQPISRRVGEIGADDPQRFARDKPGLSEQSRTLRCGQRARRSRGHDFRAPKNFVRHPVSDSSEPILEQQNGLDRRPRVPIEERVQKLAIKLVGRDVGSSRPPPGRLGPAVMKSHSSKKTRIAEDEGLLRLLQDEVIVFLRAKSGRLRPQFAAHPEMDPNPIPGGKFEQHLFPTRRGTQETAARQLLHDSSRIGSAKDPFSRMELHRDDLLAEAAVPLLSEKFHLGQFRHRTK